MVNATTMGNHELSGVEWVQNKVFLAYKMKFEGIMSLLNGILIELKNTCGFATNKKKYNSQIKELRDGVFLCPV